MSRKRPVNLSLGQVLSVNKGSPVAMASILHRISGVVAFVFIPVVLYVLQLSLASSDGFTEVCQMFDNVFVRYGVAVFVAALVYHLIMGIKHMLQDLGVGESSYKSAKNMAAVFLVIGIVAALAAFVWVIKV